MTIVGPELPISGQTVLGHTFDMGPGGKGSNQAIGAKRLGGDVTLVAKVGNDTFGDDAVALFEREGLAGQGILRTDRHTGVGLILVDDRGRNMIAVAPGANAELTLEDVKVIPDLWAGARVMLCQLECPPELFLELAGQAMPVGVISVLNPAPAQPLGDAHYALTDVLTPNETELGVLTGLPTADDEEVETAARRLLDWGVRSVVVTLGERGAMWISGTGSRRFPAFGVRAQDSTGAGDAFNAGLVTALAAGASMEDAVALGCRAGAFCVTRIGVIDGLPTREQLDAEVPPT